MVRCDVETFGVWILQAIKSLNTSLHSEPSRTCRGEYAAAAAVGSEFWVATLGGFFRGGPWVGGLRLVNAVLTQSWTHPENVPQVMGGGENCRSSTVEIWDEQGQWRPGPEMRPEDIMNLL